MENNNYILITGATSDLGAESARGLARNHSLILSGRDENELNVLKSNLENKSKHLIWVCDLNNDDIILKLTEFLESTKVNICSFIHFAGFFKVTPLRLVKKEDVLKSFNINVISAIQIISLLSKKKYRKSLKDIIFISTISSLRGNSGFSVYSSSKSALKGFMKSLAIELAPINVNLLTLGAIVTKRTQQLLDPLKEELENHIPLGLGKVDSVALWVEFLVNNENKWVTGQEIIIDGGTTVL